MTRVIFFGTRCGFASQSLNCIMAAGATVAAIVLPGSTGVDQPFLVARPQRKRAKPNRLPVANRTLGLTEDPFDSADAEIVHVTDLRHPLTQAKLSTYEADIGLSSCFTSRIPPEVAAVPSLGVLNVHPSLLPHYRGPDPLFWQFRDGVLESGVTVHVVDQGLDSGPIVEQQTFRIPRQSPGDQIWHDMGKLGGELLVRAMERTLSGSATSCPQNLSSGSYQSWPTPEDLEIIPELWLAWRIEHFVRGVRPLGYSPIIVSNGRRIPIRNVATGPAPTGRHAIEIMAQDEPVLIEPLV